MNIFRSLVPYAQKHRGNIDGIIRLWLADVMENSQSIRSHDTYKMIIETFRANLLSSNHDLDGLPVDREATGKEKEDAIALLATAAQGFAIGSKRGRTLAAATVNQRLSILSSFYTFARKRRFLKMDNPIDLLSRPDVQEYAKAQPLSQETIERVLRGIDRSVLAGKRDYALLLVFLNTGRRASEVLSLQLKHIEPVENTAILHFEHCKGGGQMYDKLEPRTWNALYAYIRAAYERIEPEYYVWLSLSMKNFKQPLTQRGLADIFKKHFNTMKVHTTRHTFAHSMKKVGADTRTIQKRLGHSSEATTERYLEQLTSAENEFASRLLDYYGVE